MTNEIEELDMDDKLNMETGVPHYSMVVDEIEQWANVVQLVREHLPDNSIATDPEFDTDRIVDLGVIAYAMEQYGKALERSIIEANNLRNKLKALNEMNKALRGDEE